LTAATTPPQATIGRDLRSRLGSLWAGLVSQPIARIVAKRVLMAIPIVLGISILTFWVLASVPGDSARLQLGINATQADVDRLNHQLGLDKPALTRYLTWLGGLLHGNLGRSIVSNQPVSELFSQRFPVTAELVILSFVVSLAVSIPAALLSARRPGGLVDRVVMFLSVAGLSVANYVLALLLVLVFAVEAHVLPAIGYVPFTQDPIGNLRDMILPTLSLAIPLMCFYARFLRSDLVDQMQQEEYIDTARAKGLGPWRILVGHAFRNSSFGLITLVGLNISVLVGVTVIIESIFALPGIGQLLLQSINTRDFTVVQDCVVVFALVAVAANLVVDLLYAILDPRIRYDSR
jgi:peptide/nickel transport system permease protein